MKRTHIPTIIGILLVTAVGLLFSSGNAEAVRQKIGETDLAIASLDTVTEHFDELFAHMAAESKLAQEDMAKARQRGSLEAYRSAYGKLVTLSSYAMTKEETEIILGRIMAEEEPNRAKYAAWLYQVSAYYRPKLSIDFSVEGDAYRYSYVQQVSKAPGTEVVLPASDDLRFNTQHTGVLVGWGLAPDTVEYQAGQAIAMPYTDQTLYAIWRKQVTFTDRIGDLHVVHEDVAQGDVIEVPAAKAPDDMYRFAGWHDRSTGRVLEGDTYTVTGNGASFEAAWKKIVVQSVNTIYYGLDRLPGKTQIAVGFSLHNAGNVDASAMEVKLSSDSPYVKLLTDTVGVRSIPVGLYRTNNSARSSQTEQAISGEANTFRIVIDGQAPSGTVVPLRITVTDRSGEAWSYDFSFTVK
jgi:hypothetical protein